MRKKLLGKIGILLMALFSINANAYVVAGADSALTPGSGGWSWDGEFLAGFRDALENPNFFGDGGVVEEAVETVTLSAVNSTTLAGADMFIVPWLKDSDGPAFSDEVLSFFYGGGDLFLLQDSAGWDYIGELLGVQTSASTGSVSNGGAPFFEGAFGSATDVTQHYQVGQVSAADVTSHNGSIIGTNVEGQVTSAYWAPGDYAEGAGALFLIADVDMIASGTAGCGVDICGAWYGDDPSTSALADLNNNAIYALNTFSFIQSGGELQGSVPTPATLTLMLLGIVGMSFLRKKKV